MSGKLVRKPPTHQSEVANDYVVRAGWSILGFRGFGSFDGYVIATPI